MASAIITAVRGSGRNLSGGADLIVTCCFNGSDVDSWVEGRAYEDTVRLPSGYSLADFMAGLAGAVQSRATILGLTVSASDVEFPVFAHRGAMILGRGEVTLAQGIATVPLPGIPANAIVLLSPKTLLGTVAALSWAITEGASFSITSVSALNLSVVAWIVLA